MEVDELYSYVKTLPENTAFGDPIHGEMFCFLGIDRGSKLIISHLIGKRLASNCARLMHDISERVQGRVQLSTDGFPAYTGASGAVWKAFGNDVDYGVEVKTFGRQPGASRSLHSGEKMHAHYPPSVHRNSQPQHRWHFTSRENESPRWTFHAPIHPETNRIQQDVSEPQKRDGVNLSRISISAGRIRA